MLILSVLSRISHESVRGNTPMEKATFENRIKPSFDCSTEECQRSPGERWITVATTIPDRHGNDNIPRLMVTSGVYCLLLMQKGGENGSKFLLLLVGKRPVSPRSGHQP